MATKIQDMPPPGGYKKIPFARIPARTYFSGFQMIAGYLAMTAGATYLYFLNCQDIKRERVEQRSGRFAVLPLLLAERDREYLKQIRRNRDEEEKLMANVPGWEVGTWFGEPIYHTVPKDTFVDPQFREYYAHADYKNFAKRANVALWS